MICADPLINGKSDLSHTKYVPVLAKKARHKVRKLMMMGIQFDVTVKHIK